MTCFIVHGKQCTKLYPGRTYRNNIDDYHDAGVTDLGLGLDPRGHFIIPTATRAGRVW